MSLIKNLFSLKTLESAWPGDPDFDPKQLLIAILILVFWLVLTLAIIYAAFHPQLTFAAGISLPSGSDESGKLEAAGILLRILDIGIFTWGARLFAGLCIMSSAWALKEQRFGIAIICVVGAIIFGTAPKWVQNIFNIGGNGGIFSTSEYRAPLNSKGHQRYV